VGISLRLDALSVIQTGTIAAVAVAFGKFLGVFFPAVSTSNWLWHIAHVPPIPVGPMVLGNMEIGVNTANLNGIIVVIFLAVVNIFGVSWSADSKRLHHDQGALPGGADPDRFCRGTQRHGLARQLRRGILEECG